MFILDLLLKEELNYYQAFYKIAKLPNNFEMIRELKNNKQYYIEIAKDFEIAKKQSKNLNKSSIKEKNQSQDYHENEI